MPTVKTKEGASACIAFVAALLVSAALSVSVVTDGGAVRWPLVAALAGGSFCVVLFVALVLMRKYVAYKLKPIYSLVLSRNVHTGEVLGELKEKHVERLGDELKAWAEAGDRELGRLQEAERFRRQYLGSVARELKSPLLNLQGQIAALREGGLEDDLMKGEYLDRAARTAERLIAIVQDLDTISRLENGMARLDTVPFDLGALARECAARVAPEAAERGIRIEVRGADTLPSPYWVRADRRYIGMALENLLVNSVRFGREGGWTRVRFRDMLDRILIEVEDDGRGIGREELPRIFERFYRAEQGESDGTGGTGLGLAVVKHIVEAHGGHVSARSEEGVGSTFSFALERAEPGAVR